MKKTLVTICLLISVFTNLLSQNSGKSNSVTVDTGYVLVEGGKLFYDLAGTGKNIVLLHDGMVNREIWNEQFPLLAKTYRVVRYDRRGYGKSSDPQTKYSPIADLNQLFTQLKIDKAVIFGMSSGGRLAIDFTLTYPDKVEGLVLVGAVVSGFGYTSHMNNRGGHFDARKITDPIKVNEYFVKDDPYEIYSENTVAKQKVMKLAPNFARENTVPTQPAGKVAIRSLSEIKVPALILVGEYDIPDVHAHAGAINAGIANSKREIIPRSGHLIPIEQPALFNETIMKFLDKIPR
ncbi:MAG TPA: alpha/beta hydrolase [Lentimicrobium sp.]|nr:alpha/beta hydrolase [Lentimicrobium sp.]